MGPADSSCPGVRTDARLQGGTQRGMWSAGQGRRAETAPLGTRTVLGLALMVGGPGRALCPGQKGAHGRSEDVLPGMPAQNCCSELWTLGFRPWGRASWLVTTRWPVALRLPRRGAHVQMAWSPVRTHPAPRATESPLRRDTGTRGRAVSTSHGPRSRRPLQGPCLPVLRASRRPRSLQGPPCLLPAHSGGHPSAPCPHFPRESPWGRVKVKVQL